MNFRCLTLVFALTCWACDGDEAETAVPAGETVTAGMGGSPDSPDPIGGTAGESGDEPEGGMGTVNDVVAGNEAGQGGEAGSMMLEGGSAGEADMMVMEGGSAGEENLPTMPQDTAISATLDGLVSQIATVTCESIQNCCNAEELDLYFGPIGFNPYLEDLKAQLPPDAPFDPNTCVSLLTSAYEIVPFGPWVEAVRDGYAEFDEDMATQCLESMRNATCGAQFSEVMFGGECFGFSPPSGAGVSRRALTQIGTVGDACLPLNDGVGGGFFGTCNPMIAVCAVEDEQGRRGLASIDRGETGVCIPSSVENERCSLPDFQICRRGLSCVNDVCVPPITTELQLGDTCYEGWQLQGVCANSYCDMFGQPSVCVPFKGLGDACSGALECESGYCPNGMCEDGAFCDGE